MSQQVHTVKLKPIIKAQISGKLVTSGIIVVAFASVYSEKIRMKKLMIMIIIIIIMNLSQKRRFLAGARN